MLNSPYNEKSFPNMQSTPLLVQPEAVYSCPLLVTWQKRMTLTWLRLPAWELQRVRRSPLRLLFSRLSPPQVPQLLHIRHRLQTLSQVHCPSLDLLQYLNVFLAGRDPDLSPAVVPVIPLSFHNGNYIIISLLQNGPCSSCVLPKNILTSYGYVCIY